MPTRDNDILLRLGQLVADLTAQGFYFGTDTHLLLARFFSETAEKPRSVETLKFQLAALLSRSSEEQQRFYGIFDQFVEQYKIETRSKAGDGKEETGDKLKPKIPQKDKETPPFAAPVTKPATPVARPIVGRSGPIRHELTAFPQNFWRIWNTAKIDAAMVPLREKELMPTFEWDIPASIRRTIREGGIPHFVFRQRKRAPQYLFLIDQRSPEDHLAGFYAELALEMQRRDLAAEFYFYNFIPSRCWRDRRNPHTYTYIQRLQSEYDGYKLIIVGEANGLLERPALRPSNLARDLVDGWREVALLCPKSTAQWGRAELALCQLFPVVPANAEGLSSLVRQWAATEVLTPEYWQRAVPEPSVPEIEPGDEDVADIIQNLKYYLDREGFHWLCAAATYPELYWRLTALFNDETVVPKPGLAERDQNQIWQRTLLRLSRLQWMRDGAIPADIREKLQEMLPDEKIAPVRQQLLEVLELNKDGFLSQKNSYAAADYTFTVARYEYEHALHDPNSTQADLQSKETALRQTISTVAPSDISDAKGVELWEQIASAEQSPASSGFHILWVDDYPENNKDIAQDLSKQLGATFTQVVSTNEALELLGKGTFDAIISDLGRGDSEWAGLELLEELRKRQLTIPSAIFCSTRRADENRERLLGTGAQLVTGSGTQLRKWVEDLAGEKSQFAFFSCPNHDNPDIQCKQLHAVKDGRVAQMFCRNCNTGPLWLCPNCKQAVVNLSATRCQNCGFETFKITVPDEVRKLIPNPLRAEADAEKTKGEEALRAGNYEQAEPHLQRALKILEDLNDEDSTIEVLRALAEIAVLRKEFEKAREYLSTALEKNRKSGSGKERQEAEILNSLGEVTFELGDFQSAKKIFEESLKLSERISHRLVQALAQENLGKCEQAEGNIPLAIDYLRRARDNFAGLDNKQKVSEIEQRVADLEKRLASESKVSKEQIQELIAVGQTKDALNLLVQANPDALLLRAQYNNGEKQFSLGLIDFGEWQRVQARVNFATLEVANKLKSESKVGSSQKFKPLAEIRKDLQMLVVEDLPSAITTLQGLLPDGDKKNQTILLSGRLDQVNKDRLTNVLNNDDWQISYNQIRSTLLDLITDLEERDFGSTTGQPTQRPVATTPKFVVIYDQADEAHCKMLNKHLNVLKIMKKIRVYNVNQPLVGEDIVARAQQELADADYLIALVTVNLFNSPDWFDLLYTAIGEGRRIIPIRIEKADFEGTGLEKLRSLPSMNRAVSEFKNLDDAYADIVAELRKLLPK